MKFITRTNYKDRPKKQLIPGPPKPGLTKPHEALSIEEMFRRFSRNEPIATQQREPVWVDDSTLDSPDLEKIGKADLYEKEQFSKDLAARMKRMEAEIDATKETSKKAKAEAEEQEFLEKLAKYKEKIEKSDTGKEEKK